MEECQWLKVDANHWKKADRYIECGDIAICLILNVHSPPHPHQLHTLDRTRDDVVYSGILLKVALCVSSYVEAAAFVEEVIFLLYRIYNIYFYFRIIQIRMFSCFWLNDSMRLRLSLRSC